MERKLTSDEVRCLVANEIFSHGSPLTIAALEAFAAHLERQEHEQKRDPVTNPTLGDSVTANGLTCIYAPLEGYMLSGPDWWSEACKQEGAIVTLRREVVS